MPNVTSYAEIMSKPHWAIVSNVDEGSHTNTDHGYPAHTTTETVYTPYATEKELLDVLRRKSSHEKFVVIQAAPMKVVTETTIRLV